MTGADALSRWNRMTQAAVQHWTQRAESSAGDDRASVDLERWRRLLPSTQPVLRAIEPAPMGSTR